MPGRKGVKGFLLVGREKVPHDFGLAEDHSSDKLMVLELRGLPEPWTSTSFPEIRYPGLGKGEKEGLCICGYFKGV